MSRCKQEMSCPRSHTCEQGICEIWCTSDSDCGAEQLCSANFCRPKCDVSLKYLMNPLEGCIFGDGNSVHMLGFLYVILTQLTQVHSRYSCEKPLIERVYRLNQAKDLLR